MKIALYTNIISPHQLPLATEISKRVGAENYRYIYTEDLHAERAKMGWNDAAVVKCLKSDSSVAQQWLEDCDVLICGHRALDLIERRSRKGKLTFYASERWFKPIGIGTSHRFYVSGRIRLLVPSYGKMVRRFVALARQYDNFKLLPYGVHAQNDFIRMGVPGDKIHLWGYFVAPSEKRNNSTLPPQPSTTTTPLRVLWVGRMMQLKNVDVIIKAVGELYREGVNVELNLIGDGAEKHKLVRLATGLPVRFAGSVPIDKVRDEMRKNDVYVFPSNAMDGWGAVVSEALEEGMIVLGSEEAGATATLLPSRCRFHCRDHKRLASLLRDIDANPQDNLPIGIGDWSAARGAERFLEMCK